jgi:hypothetical protein
VSGSDILAGTYRSRWGLASMVRPRSLSNSPTSVLASTTNRKQLAAYAFAPRFLQPVRHEFLDQLLFGETSRATKIRQTVLRVSQRHPKLLRITLPSYRDVEPSTRPCLRTANGSSAER